MQEVPIAITGMHRSGTSMITRALHDSGLKLIGTGAEDLIDAAEDNPEGFWENKVIVACNDALLEAAGGAWDHPPDLPPLAVDDPRVAGLADTATAALAALSEHDHWGFKDPRTCLTAAYWLDLEPELRFVICVRHPLEVALSLKRRNQNSYSLGLALWERYYATVLEQVPEERRLVTHYDTFFVDPDGELARVCAFAGLDAATPRVRADLRHHTVGVDLGDAGASASLRTLYADLCRSAGVTPPREAPADEGRVRRLILDGAVAQRHADQRQAAIERLQEREAELRAAHVEAESRHRTRVRDLENQLAVARRDATDRLQSMQRDTGAALDELRASVARIDERTAKRFRVRPAVRAAVGQLPPPAQRTVRRGVNLARRGVESPGTTAQQTYRRVRRSARVRARRLPPPARRALRHGRGLLTRTRTAPVPTAKAVVRRLPEPAQRTARRGWRALLRARRARAVNALVGREDVKRRPTPKGPALRLWKQAFEQMVAEAWPGGTPWLVVGPGSPKEVRGARTPRATPFPETPDGRPYPDDLSHIAHLEAQRHRGHDHLVVPEGSRPWFRQQVELRDHVERTYRSVRDHDGAGAVFDLTRGPAPDRDTLRSAIDRLCPGGDPAVLDWTTVDLAGALPDLATFRPPAGEPLPYLDASVDVVVIEPGRDVEEAMRVATGGVVTVAASSSGLQVVGVVSVGAPSVAAPQVLVWVSARHDDPRWYASIEDRMAALGATVHAGPIEAAGVSASSECDVLVALEPHVLPLPGAIERAAEQVLADPARALAGKVLRADGHLESAGATVFSDRSVALIAEGSIDVRAPWHEFARPVCWAPGLLAMASSLAAAVPAPALSGRALLREWAAALWAHGAPVVYEPTVTAVRVVGDGGEPSTPLDASAWQRVLDLRPARPDHLGDGAWRYLLAHDDVEACRG